MAAPDTSVDLDWAQWLQRQLDLRNWRPVELSRRSDQRISTSTLTRWLHTHRIPDLDSIRIVCDVLGVQRVEGMIAAGYLSQADVGVPAQAVHTASKRELLAELDRRLPDDVPDHPQNSAPVQLARKRPNGRPAGPEGVAWAARCRPEG